MIPMHAELTAASRKETILNKRADGSKLRRRMILFDNDNPVKVRPSLPETGVAHEKALP